MITRNKTARAIIREIWKLWRTVDWIDEVSTIEIGIVYESAIRVAREAERGQVNFDGRLAMLDGKVIGIENGEGRT
jgi:hypothetical protein